jgi:Fic-DOC domain mobile mystery protein B
MERMMAEWTSPHVPGETPIDPSGLKVKGVTNRAELSVVEAENIRKPIAKYLASRPNAKLAPFDSPWVLRLHHEMYGDVWKWAGKIRNKEVNIGLPFPAIPENLAGLLDDLHSWPGYGMDPVEQASRLHHRAVFIHPFENGNGRWSRLLANIWMRLTGHPIIEWPEETIGTESVIREEYIATIKKADDGDIEPLIELHRRYSGSEKS